MKEWEGRGDPRAGDGEGRVIINLIRERGNKGQLLSGEGLDRGPVQTDRAECGLLLALRQHPLS